MSWSNHEVDMEALRGKVQAILDEAGGRDEEDDPRFEVLIVDRSKYGRMSFQPVPYDFDVSPRERQLALDVAFLNLQIAQEQFQRIYRFDQGIRRDAWNRQDRAEFYQAEVLWDPGVEDRGDLRLQVAATLRQLVLGARFHDLPVIEVPLGTYDKEYFLIASENTVVWHHRHYGYAIWRVPSLPQGKRIDQLPSW